MKTTPEQLEAVPVDSALTQTESLPVDDSPCNPRNWPEWKKDAQVVLAAAHSMFATFQTAGIIPGYSTLSKFYRCSLKDASYFVSSQVCLLLLSTTRGPLTDLEAIADSYARRIAPVLECIDSQIRPLSCPVTDPRLQYAF